MIKQDKFVLMPNSFPHISNYVREVVWDAVSKTIEITVSETEKLDVVAWIQHIKKQQSEIKKGPFIDLNKDALVLEINDDSCKRLAQIVFKNIDISKHSCRWLNINQELLHKMVLTYQEIDIIQNGQ